VNAYTALAMVTALAVPRFSWVLLIAAALAANQARLCWNEARLRRLRAENAELAEGVRRLAEINEIARDMARSHAVQRAAMTARPLDEWHEDAGAVLWWRFPIEEPPYVGTPLDDRFPDYVTHWTPIAIPEEPGP
jgi:hypothetical protein